MSFNPTIELFNFACELIDKLELPSYLKQVVLSNAVPDFYAEGYNDFDLKKRIQDFQERTGCLVYFVTAEETYFGFCYSFLCVSKYREDWHSHFKRCTVDGHGDAIVWAWVYNVDYDWNSEYGSILVKRSGDWLHRVG